MIRPLVALALLAAGTAAVAADAPAGKIQTLRAASAAPERCRGALFVPAGKINTHGHEATVSRCDPAFLAAAEGRRAPLAGQQRRN